MILIALAAVCVISVPLTGGRLGALAELPVRWLWMGPVALAAQVVIVTVAPGGDRTLHAGVHVATYVLIGGFLWANRRLAGITVITVGAVCNAVAIVVNDGIMPTAAAAQRLAGLAPTRGFQNSAVVGHPRLLWLGDIVPVPGPLPNVLSMGDCVIFAGMLVLLHRTCRPSAAPSRGSALEPGGRPAVSGAPPAAPVADAISNKGRTGPRSCDTRRRDGAVAEVTVYREQ